MTSPLQRILLSFTIKLRRAAALAMVLALTVVVIPSAQEQTYKLLYGFNGGQDGSGPVAGVTMDAGGNLYGTTDQGGNIGGNCKFGCGTVFKLTHKGSGWVFTPLYLFQDGNDGSYPEGKVIFGPDGSLYGTTFAGGGSTCQGLGYQGCGTIFNLKPPPTTCKTAFVPGPRPCCIASRAAAIPRATWYSISTAISMAGRRKAFTS